MDEQEFVPVKRPRGRPRMTQEEKNLARKQRESFYVPNKFGSENVQPGDNSRYLSHAMTIARMPLVDLDDEDEVRERIYWYFELCVNNDIKPTVMGLCNSLKIDRKSLLRWKNEETRGGTYKALAVEAYGMMEELWEHYMQNGKINPVAGIFLGKNNFGYADKQEVTLSPGVGQIAPEDVATIEAKYAELPEVD